MIANWLRAILASIAGFIAWFVVATAGNFLIRWFVPGYTEVEKAMDFSLVMLLARLLLGAVASVAAGAVCIAIARSVRPGAYILALVLLAMFVPMHVSLWQKFPAWYHIFFLGSLVPFVLLGARLASLRREPAA